MTCYAPLRLYRSAEGPNRATGRWPLSSKGYIDKPVEVPCGKCIGCRLEYSRQWAIRGMHELHSCSRSSFITLTYSDEYLPWGGSHPTLVPEDLQLFLKRLRKHFEPTPIRFMACGEYGSQTFRPHYHLILFGVDFDDKILYTRRHKKVCCISNTLQSLWPYGNHDIGDVSFESIAYVARYILDKQLGPDKDLFYSERGIEPEFFRMSRRPGIGYQFFSQFSSDIFPRDVMVIRGGIKTRPPRYYSNKFELQNPEQFKDVKNARKKHMIKNARNNTLHQLRISERVKLSQLNSKQLLTRSKI